MTSVNLTSMFKRIFALSAWLAVSFCFTAQTYAAPADTAVNATQADDMQNLLINKGLLQQIGGHIVQTGGQLVQVGQSVSERTSDLVSTAIGFLGIPYRRGGNSIEGGFDCSGFVRAIYKETIGLVLPRSADQQANATQIIDKNELRPGDLVFFNTMKRTFSHVGIYLGEGKFIHSPRSGAHVRIEDMRIPYWNVRFDGARRVPGGNMDTSKIQALQAVDNTLR
jgi:cell wall-associated NlpC family hydrolase